MKVIEEQGYLVVAVGDVYIKCAQELARSIHGHNPNASVTLLTDAAIELEEFNYVKVFPYANDTNNSFAWDWQCFYASPYRETIKLEADMLVTSNIDHYWDICCKRDVCISTGARNFYGNTSNSRHYRKMFDDNKLPDVYNAMIYWRLSNTAKEFFDLTRSIFENWDQFKSLILYAEDIPSTDVVYAMASKIIGIEHTTLPKHISPTITHMKKHINSLLTEDWTRELTWEAIGSHLKINTVFQSGLFHYYIKDWANEYRE